MSWSTDDVYALCAYLVTVGELAHSGLDGFEHTLDGFEHTMVGSLIPPPPVARTRIEAFFHRVGSIGLRAKIAGMVAAVVVGLGLTASLVVRSNLTRVLERSLETHALSVARAVASHHLDAISAAAGLRSHQLIQSMVDTDPEGLYALIQESDGSVLVEAARSEAPPERLSGGPLPARTASSSGSIRTSAGRVFEAVLPLSGTDSFARVGL